MKMCFRRFNVSAQQQAANPDQEYGACDNKLTWLPPCMRGLGAYQARGGGGRADRRNRFDPGCNNEFYAVYLERVSESRGGPGLGVQLRPARAPAPPASAMMPSAILRLAIVVLAAAYGTSHPLDEPATSLGRRALRQHPCFAVPGKLDSGSLGPNSGLLSRSTCAMQRLPGLYTRHITVRMSRMAQQDGDTAAEDLGRSMFFQMKWVPAPRLGTGRSPARSARH
jgi:hypothetical protein